MGRLCYPTTAPPRICPGRPENCHAAPRASEVSSGGARRVWFTFCRPGTNFKEHYACRDTSLIGAGILSRYRIFIGGTGAVVSRRSEAESGVAVQFVSEPVNCHSAGFKLRAGARFAHRSGAKVGVRVHIPLLSCLGSRSKSKNRDNRASRSFSEGWTTYPYCPC